jgi:enamine deaminase RidA (YjgF/YER057c/UK114 family)
MKGGGNMEERIMVFSTEKCLEHTKRVSPSWYEFCKQATDSWVYNLNGLPAREIVELGYAVMEDWLEEVEIGRKI